MKKAISTLLAMMLAASMFSGCASSPATSSSTSTGEQNAASQTTSQAVKTSSKIRVGTMALTVGVPVQYAYDKGYYKDEGLDVDIVMFATGNPINEAFSAGQIDIAASGLASVFSLSLPDTKWIGEINSTGGLGVYVRKDSKLLTKKGELKDYPNMYGNADLIKGMKVLGPVGTTAEFNADGYAQRFGLKSTDIKMTQMDYGPAWQAFQSGQGDAFAANPPYSFQAEEKGYVCAATFEDATGISLYDGIFASSKFINANHDAVVKFLKATYKACDELQDKKTRYDYSMQWFTKNGKKYTESILNKEIDARKYVNKDYISSQADKYNYGNGMQDIAKIYKEDGKITAENYPNVAKSIDPSLIKEAIGADLKTAQ
nr:ABC transporter substrate-binding protein [uncultured Caproiciproducens sp.]